MPELPEVETMVRGIRPALEGRTLRDVKVHDPFMLQGCEARVFERQNRGAIVDRVGRRGKWVVIALRESRGIIVIQPRMTGGFWLIDPRRPEHVRLSFHLDEPPGSVWFCDARRLGKIAWYPGAEDAERAFARSHGPDALEITSGDLAARLKRTGRGIKATLMDQKVLAGIGNLYADEVLFEARVHPERLASSLSKAEVGRIHSVIGEVLSRAITAQGSSFDLNYRTVLGVEGGNQRAMYGRGGKPCLHCGSEVVKTRIAGLIGRPTHYCPKCQPARPPKRSRSR